MKLYIYIYKLYYIYKCTILSIVVCRVLSFSLKCLARYISDWCYRYYDLAMITHNDVMGLKHNKQSLYNVKSDNDKIEAIYRHSCMSIKNDSELKPKKYF